MSHKAGLAQAAVMPVSWSKFAARSGGRLPPFFSRVARTDMSAVGGTSGGSGGALEMLQSIAASDRLLYLQELVLETAREVSGNGELDGDAPLMESGLDSLAQVELRNTLSSRLHGMQLSATLFLDYPTVKGVASYLLQEIMPSQGVRGGLQRVVLSADASSEGLAVVGMACRLPGGSDSPAAFWEMLAEGRD
ncbi:type i fatty acid, partial [Nannochloropsis gaditana CCMP526]|uniref:type i fatty acid n=1 Tax=Nannochloropsis gaditana (strain CCMP526) TaxID=1093141 RepID=UPI00029F557F